MLVALGNINDVAGTGLRLILACAANFSFVARFVSAFDDAACRFRFFFRIIFACCRCDVITGGHADRSCNPQSDSDRSFGDAAYFCASGDFFLLDIHRTFPPYTYSQKLYRHLLYPEC